MISRARFAPLLFVGAFATARVEAQQNVVVRDAGPGPAGRYLAAALAKPHRVVAPAAGPTELPRDSSYATTVIILDRDAIISGRVNGDVIVLGGNAFLHPGAIISGRVVAFGGGVYPSFLALVFGGTESHRDFTYDVHPTATGYALRYRALRRQGTPVFSLPGIYGVRIPSYDRVDGLSLPVGPTFTFDTGYVAIDPTITYRSEIGAFDPAIHSDLRFGPRTRAELFAGRTTLTNDDWIWSDLANSLATLARGLDTRNYYRADRAQVTLYHLFEGSFDDFEPFVGVRVERDRSVGPDSFAIGGPWSLFGRTSTSRMLRPNPSVAEGTLAAALLGAHFEWQQQNVRASLDLTNETAALDGGSRRFNQTTVGGSIRFPTFAAQEFFLDARIVETFGDSTPRQRWSYLGGSGTLTTLPLLSLGGDELLFIESDYLIPIQSLNVPLLGAPNLTVRHFIGASGVGGLPALEQNLGLRVAISMLRIDFVIDPARRVWEFGYGLTIAR